MNELFAKVAELFAAQDGVASVERLYALGMTRRMVRTRIDRGEWTRLTSQIVALRSTRPTWRQTVRAAWLDAGADAAVSHTTAARLHGFDGFDRVDDVHVTVCGARHRTSRLPVTVHRSGLLELRDCAAVDGIRVVSKPIALVQLAVHVGQDATAKAMDGMLRTGASPEWIRRVATDWHGRGARGATEVLDLLAQRIGRPLPRSWFQRIAKRLLASRALVFVDEHRVDDPITGARLADLDLANTELRIGVECQSWEWHASPGARAADARRKRRLRLLGWELVEVWWTDLRRLDEVVQEIQFLIDQRIPRLLA